MKHIVLLGDSIFDNSAYVGFDQEDVPSQLKSMLNDDFKVTNLAVDGDVTEDITDQLNKMPSDATHLFLSIGGNDGLSQLSILNESVRTVGDALQKMYVIGEAFKETYSEMMDRVLKYKLPTAVCNIYYPKFHPQSLNRVVTYLPLLVNGEVLQQMAMSAETVFNDIIMHEVFVRNLPLIDLRILCNEDEDFANPIEPSSIGGFKIASTIKKVVENHSFDNKNITSTVYANWFFIKKYAENVELNRGGKIAPSYVDSI